MAALASSIKTAFGQIPYTLKIFLARVVLLFIAWKLLYLLVLFPSRTPDAQLTRFTTNVTATVYAWFYPDATLTIKDKVDVSNGLPMQQIWKNNEGVITVADGCNGLEVAVLYLGFLVCIPGVKAKRIMAFALLGLAVIFVLNIARVVGLGFVHLYNRQFFDIAHHYIFKIIIYGVIFYLWMLFVRKSKLNYE